MCKHKPDDAERKKWQNPDIILPEIGVKPGTKFIDAGCGRGYFALPAARLTGPTGWVWGFDSNPEAILSLSRRATTEGLNNLELAVGRAEELVVCQKCADIVFYGVVLHDFTEPLKALANAQKMLKDGGRLVNLDWKKERMLYGPSFEKRFDARQASEIIRSAGFTIENVDENGLYHYIITAKP
ncbi:MAG: methyltransferase domain-containing protein [Dehalococcoidales bacterium]|jgi:ubiquinone/menaquinone biosynthesis C-methylase UbiE|nr:methyltransferase domain-containing protein [Dehalococcoidales bacterium]MDX9986350.1 methyltransferase domain-containing protein [Dehalococcoidales bacterium]